MTMSQDKKAVAQTQTHVIKNPINLILRSKVKCRNGIMNVRDISSPCVKYGKLMSKQKKLWAGHDNMPKTQ